MIPTKIIETIYDAKLISAENIGKKTCEEWKWRLNYVGKTGRLQIMENEHGRYIYFRCQSSMYYSDEYLTTGIGEITYKSRLMIVITRNSKYIFALPRGEYGKT